MVFFAKDFDFVSAKIYGGIGKSIGEKLRSLLTKKAVIKF